MDMLKFAQDFERVIQKRRDTVGSYDEPDNSGGQNGFTVVLDNKNTEQAQYQDAPLFAGQTLAVKTSEQDTTVQQPAAMGIGAKNLQKASSLKKQKPIPEQIRRMRNLYQYGNGTFKQICKNFYVQGKFMESYEDNEPWNGSLNSYFILTYHSLSLAELRGYFTWRTELRKGNHQDHCGGFVRIYLDELINGIGAASAEESLRKMQEFEKVFPGAGFGRYENRNLRENLHQRMLGFAVLNNIPPEVARKYIDGRLLERDAGIEILHNPEKFGDQEVFNALCTFGGKKISESKLIRQQGTEAIRLFAAVWRLASAQYRKNGKTLFYLCFGDRKELRWYPLEYTLYYNPKKQKETIYELNPSRSYRFTQGEWYISTYQSYYFNKQILADFLHETDRRLRLYLKAGHSLKERQEAAWVVPYIESIIEEDRKAKLEAARPKITIDFAGLDKIRQDALETQGSLLTDEETMGSPEAASKQTENSKHTGTPEYGGDAIPDAASIPIPAAVPSTASMPSAAAPSSSAFGSSVPSGVSVPLDGLLDGMQMQVLRMLLRGEPVQALIAAQHGLPHVIADSINEALFDYIGDNAVDCDGETFTLVEDYRDEIAKIVGEETT